MGKHLSLMKINLNEFFLLHAFPLPCPNREKKTGKDEDGDLRARISSTLSGIRRMRERELEREEKKFSHRRDRKYPLLDFARFPVSASEF